MRFLNYLTELKEDWTGIFPGRTQGVTIAHATIIKMMGKNHPKSYICLVKGKESSREKKRNPFPEDLQIEMLKRVAPPNVEIRVVPTGFIPDIIDDLPEERFVVYSGPDRISGYRQQIKYAKEVGKQLKIVDVSSMMPIGREEVSATKMRNALLEDDFDTFSKIAPEEIHSMYEKLRDALLENWEK